MPSIVSRGPRTAVRCWVIGDKYDMEDFQDEAMLALIKYCETSTLDLDAMKEAVSSPAYGSKLRKLVAEEAVHYQKEDNSACSGDFQDFDGVGFISEYIEALNAYDDEEIKYERLEEKDGDDEPRWKEFMIGDGPTSHWIVGECP